MAESNVSQPSPQIGVGFGTVKKFREIVVTPGTTDKFSVIDAAQATPIALGDLLAYVAGVANTVRTAVTGDLVAAVKMAGLAAYEAVVNSTGVFGYKPAAGDPIAVYRKGRYYIVNVDGVVAPDEELIVGTVAGSVKARGGDTTRQVVGVCRVGNSSVAGDPIEADIDTTVVKP